METNSIRSLSYLARQHIVLLQGAVLWVLTGLMLLGVTTALFTRARESQEMLEKKRAESEELSAQVVFLTQLDGEVLRARMEILNAALPPTKDVLTFLNTIDGLSRELSLSLKGIQLSPGELASASGSTVTQLNKESSGMHSLDTQLSIGGAEESIYSFLRAVEQTAPLMRVKDVKVSRVGENNFNLNVRLAMLYADPAEPGGLKGKTVLFTDDEEAMLRQITGLKTYTPLGNDNGVLLPAGKSNLFEQLQLDID